VDASGPRRYQIRVCRGPECGDRRGSARIHQALRAAIADRDLAERVALGWQSCFGRCTQGPNVLVREIPTEVTAATAAPAPGRRPATALYNGVDVVHAVPLIQEHVEHGVVVRALLRLPPPGASGIVVAAPRPDRGPLAE
jgi:(2Fe-2S) ferredoxin